MIKYLVVFVYSTDEFEDGQPEGALEGYFLEEGISHQYHGSAYHGGLVDVGRTSVFEFETSAERADAVGTWLGEHGYDQIAELVQRGS